jgi:hypothetical protein
LPNCLGRPTLTLGATDWQQEYHRLNAEQKNQLLDILAELKAGSRERPERIARLDRPFRSIIEHYYPGGETPSRTPEEEILAQQGVSVGYDSGPG